MEVLKFSRVLAIFVFVVFTGGQATALEKGKTLSADEIISKAISQAKDSASRSAAAQYSFTQVTVREELDGKGCLKERKENENEVCSNPGSFLKNASKRPAKTPNKSTDSDPLKLKKYKCSTRSDAVNLLTPDLLSKYAFALIAQTNINGRAAYEIAFKPKANNLPGKDLAEKILNQASGRLWIDTTEFELAKAHIQINSEITVGGGLLGSLKRAMVVLERIRLDGGVWFDRFYKTDYEARKLAQSRRVITRCEARGFRKISEG